MVKKVYLTKRNKKAKNLNIQNLNQRDLYKLHHLFGHCHPDKLEPVIKTSGRWNDNIKEMLNKLLECEVCKIERRRIPKLKVSPP